MFRMRSVLTACAVLLGAVSAVPALANMCISDSGRRCATGMPVDGYCMCGNEGGTVVGPHQVGMQPPPMQSQMMQSTPMQPPGMQPPPPPNYPPGAPPPPPSPYRPPPPPQ